LPSAGEKLQDEEGGKITGKNIQEVSLFNEGFIDATQNERGGERN